MARCRFCGSQVLNWKNLNEPSPATVAPPGSSIEQIRLHNEREQLRLTQAVQQAPKWQLTERDGNRHSCPLSIEFYSRGTSPTRKNDIDAWLRQNPRGTTNVSEVLPIPSVNINLTPAIPPPPAALLPPPLAFPINNVLQFPPVPMGSLLSPNDIMQVQAPADRIASMLSTSEVTQLLPLNSEPTSLNICWAGEWDVTRNYDINDIVLYQACFYRAKLKTVGSRPGNTHYWDKPNSSQMLTITQMMGRGEARILDKPKLDLEKRSIKI